MTPLIDGRQCRGCQKVKPLSDFNKNKTCSKGRTRTCKECASSKRSSWYNANRRRRQEAANKRNQERKRLVVEHFGDKCADCGVTYPQCVYEFHHLDPNEKDVNPSKALGWSEDRMWRELDKCIMLCSNCHKIRHFGLGDCEVAE
jgi:hypothetical protein